MSFINGHTTCPGKQPHKTLARSVYRLEVLSCEERKLKHPCIYQKILCKYYRNTKHGNTLFSPIYIWSFKENTAVFFKNAM